MRNPWYGFLAIVFLGLSLLLAPAISRAQEITGDKPDLKIEQKSDQKADADTEWKKEVAPESKIEDQTAPKAEEKTPPKLEEKPVLKNESSPKTETEEKPGSITAEKAVQKPEDQPAGKPARKSPLWQRWDTHSYVELDLVLDRYWGAFNQIITAKPIGASLRRGGDWKYAAFHFYLTGAYDGSPHSDTTRLNSGKLGLADMGLRLNGVLPVLYGVMLQAGLMEETWAEFSWYETLAQKETNIYIVTGLGPNIMLSFSPVKYVSLNFEYSAILVPFVEKHLYGAYARDEGFTADDYPISKASFSTIEVGLSVRPLKYLSAGVTYGEKKSSHHVTLKDKDHPQNSKTVPFESLNDYLLIMLTFTY